MKHLKDILDILTKTNNISMLKTFSRKKYDPWKILIGTILSARCTDEVTMPVSEKLFKVYPDPWSLSKANIKDVEDIIRPTGFFKNKSRYIIETSKRITQNDGNVPKDIKELTKLPGVGKKVAGCVLVYAHDIPSIPVDTHVAVISKRLGWTDKKDPDKIMDDLMEKIPKKYWHIINEVLVIHGKTVCFKRKPKCSICKIIKYCKYEDKNLG